MVEMCFRQSEYGQCEDIDVFFTCSPGRLCLKGFLLGPNAVGWLVRSFGGPAFVGSRVIPGDSWWFLVMVPGDGSWRFMAVPGGSWRFLAVPGGSW